MTLGFPFGSKNFCKLLCVSWVWLSNLVSQQRIVDCFRDSLSSLKTLWSALMKSPETFRSGHDCISTSSANIWIVLKNAYLHCAYPNPVPLLLAAPLEFHEMTWKCFDFHAVDFSKALLKCFHQPNSIWIPTVNQTIYAIYFFVLLIHHFFLGFDFCRSRSSPLVLPLLSCTGFSVFLLFPSNTEFCNENVGEVGEGVVEEELANKPGTIYGTWFDILQSILSPFLIRCGFSPLIRWYVHPWSSQSCRERSAGVSSRSTNWRISPIVSHIPSLLLWFARRRCPSSPSSDSSMSSWSRTRQNWGLAHWPHACSLRNLPQTPRLFCWCSRQCPFFRGRVKCIFIFFFELVNVLARFHALLWAHHFCLPVSSWDFVSNFVA